MARGLGHRGHGGDRDADRQGQDQGPADDPPAAVLAGQHAALGVAEARVGDGHQQDHVGGAQPAAALDDREPDHHGQAEAQRGPVGGARPLAGPQHGDPAVAAGMRPVSTAPCTLLTCRSASAESRPKPMPTVAATISMRGSSGPRRQQRLAAGPQHDDGQHRGGHRPADADQDRPERPLGGGGGRERHAEAASTPSGAEQQRDDAFRGDAAARQKCFYCLS